MKLRRVRLATLGVAVTLAVTACGDATSFSDQISTSEDLLRIAAETQSDYESWAGDAASLQAAAFLKGHGLNGDYSSCLNERGFDDDWEVSIGPITPRYFFGQAAALSGPDDWRPSQTALVNAKVGRNAWMLEVPAPPERVHDENECRSKYPGLSDEEISQLAMPDVVSNLNERWVKALEQVIPPGAEDEINSCFAGSKLPGEFSGKSSPDDWYQLMDDAEPPASLVPVGDEAASPEWQRYLELEATIVDALWKCHFGDYGALVKELPETQAEFHADHADELERARLHWVEIRDLATRLGWTPERPQGTLKIVPQPTSP